MKDLKSKQHGQPDILTYAPALHKVHWDCPASDVSMRNKKEIGDSIRDVDAPHLTATCEDSKRNDR